MTRRHALMAATFAGLLAAPAMIPVAVGRAQEPARIGFIYPSSGPSALTGRPTQGYVCAVLEPRSGFRVSRVIGA